MKKIRYFLLLILSLTVNVDAIEDGTYTLFYGNGDTNVLTEPLVLDEGQSCTFIRAGNSSSQYFDYYPITKLSDGSFVTNHIPMQLKTSSSPHTPYPEDIRTLVGPLTITRISGGHIGAYVFRIKTEREKPEFSVSLDNDGDRIAIGYKEDGTNAVVKVYAFDGAGWNQLGDEIE